MVQWQVPVARVCYRNTDSWHCTKVRCELLTVGRPYRRPHQLQPLIFKKIIKKSVFLKRARFFIFDWRNWYQIDFKIFISNWLQMFSNFRIKIRRNINNKKLIRVWYAGNKIWSGNQQIIHKTRLKMHSFLYPREPRLLMQTWLDCLQRKILYPQNILLQKSIANILFRDFWI
jgi:hypothetical protein